MKINGEVDIKSNKKEVLDAFEEAVETALDAVGSQATTLAARELQKTPSRIDTGLLKNSITWAIGGKSPAISSYSADRPSKYSGKTPDSGSYSGTAPADSGKTRSVYVGTNVEYAIYVHEGTDRMKANRFLKNAIMDNRDEFLDIIKKTLKNV